MVKVGHWESLYTVGLVGGNRKLTIGRDAESTARQSDRGGGVEGGKGVLV